MKRPPSTPPTEPLDLDALEKELAELSAHLDAATHRQLTLIRLIDESGLWATQGAKSCAHWLMTDDELGMSVSEWLNANGFEREGTPEA